MNKRWSIKHVRGLTRHKAWSAEGHIRRRGCMRRYAFILDPLLTAPSAFTRAFPVLRSARSRCARLRRHQLANTTDPCRSAAAESARYRFP